MYEIDVQAPQPDGKTNSIWSHPLLMTEAGRMDDLEPKLLTVYKGQFKAAELPLYERRRLGRLSMIKAPSSYYQELCFFHQDETLPQRRSLDELNLCMEIAKYLKSHYHKVNFNLSPTNYDVRGFTWNQLKATPLYTYIHTTGMQLQPLKDARTKLNRAGKRSYSFECRLDIEGFLSLSESLFERKGPHLFSNPDRMRFFMHHLHEAGILSQYNVCHEGVVKSSNIMVALENGTAYSILRASDHPEMQHGISLWHTLQLAEKLSQSYDCIDFCGANVPEVARFKAASGLKLRLFFRISS